MNHPDRLRLLDAINGVADDAAAREVKSHLEACGPCRAEYDSMMSATEALSVAAFGEREGTCLTEQELSVYLARTMGPEAEGEVEEHLSSCRSCLDDCVRTQELLESGEMPAVRSEFVARVKALGTPSALYKALKTARVTARVSRRFRRETRFAWPFAAAAAALLLVAVVLVVAKSQPVQKPGGIAKSPTPVEPDLPDPDRVPDLPTPAPKPEPPQPEGPKPETPTPAPVVPQPDTPRTETPKPVAPTPEEPKTPAPKPDPTRTEKRYRAVEVASIRGRLQLNGRPVMDPATVGHEAVLSTDERFGASFRVRGECEVFLREKTQLRIECLESGETLVRLEAGEALFEVKKRQTPFVVRTAHADATVVGTEFDVALVGRTTVLTVVEGAIDFGNDRDTERVLANQRCVVHAGERPRKPTRLEAARATEWARVPELDATPPKTPWMEHYPNLNRLPGVVIAAPYSETDLGARTLAEAIAETLGAGLFAGHNYRNRERRVWVNVDRGTEGKFDDRGEMEKGEKETEHARRVFEDYQRRVRESAGLDRGPVPLIVTIRKHSDNDRGNLCDVAVFGLKKETLPQIKALYLELAQKHGIEKPVELRVDGLDDVKYRESDAKRLGWMTTGVCKKGIAFFFPSTLGERGLAAYAPVLSELVQALAQQR